jgi:hypothetical protein
LDESPFIPIPNCILAEANDVRDGVFGVRPTTLPTSWHLLHEPTKLLGFLLTRKVPCPRFSIIKRWRPDGVWFVGVGT